MRPRTLRTALRMPPDAGVADGRHAGHAMGGGDDAGGDRAPLRLVLVEAALVRAVAQHAGEPDAQLDRVLDAGVHALAAGGAVHVRGVAGEEHPPLPVAVGEPVVDAEPRAPHDVLHPRGRSRGPRASSSAWMWSRSGCCGRVVDRGDDPVTAAGQRRHDRQTGGREVQHHLAVVELPVQVHVREHERLAVAVADEVDPGFAAHGAVHAVRADDIQRADRLTAGHGRGHAVGVLGQPRQLVGPVHPAAELGAGGRSARPR